MQKPQCCKECKVRKRRKEKKHSGIALSAIGIASTLLDLPRPKKETEVNKIEHLLNSATSHLRGEWLAMSKGKRANQL